MPVLLGSVKPWLQWFISAYIHILVGLPCELSDCPGGFASSSSANTASRRLWALGKSSPARNSSTMHHIYMFTNVCCGLQVNVNIWSQLNQFTSVQTHQWHIQKRILVLVVCFWHLIEMIIHDIPQENDCHCGLFKQECDRIILIRIVATCIFRNVKKWEPGVSITQIFDIWPGSYK